MYDQELCLEILRQIEGAAIKIGSRFQVIPQAPTSPIVRPESKN
jgi:hypothetical protein